MGKFMLRLLHDRTRRRGRRARDRTSSGRRFQCLGTLSRSFYVGDAVSEEDIHAKYEDGILKLSVPKKAPKAVEKNGYIAIEG